MALAKTALTSNSATSFIIDAGIIGIDFKFDTTTNDFSATPIGATVDGVKLTIDKKLRAIKVDGTKPYPNVKGLWEVDSVGASVAAKVKELSPENIAMALNGTLTAAASTEAPSGYQKIEMSRYINDSMYHEVAIWGFQRGTGKAIVVMLHNGLVTSDKFEMDMKDGDESQPEITITANADYTMINAGKSPYTVFFPEDGTVQTGLPAA